MTFAVSYLPLDRSDGEPTGGGRNSTENGSPDRRAGVPRPLILQTFAPPFSRNPCYVTSKSEHICNSKPEHLISSR